MDYKIKIIKQNEFPEKLKNIRKAPKELYAIGDVNLLYEDGIGIVGTRKPTEYGIQICKEFSKEFALRNIPIVSGMAIGIDEIAHKTALEYNAKTIGVLGYGFDYYLKFTENREIFAKIVEKGGLIISEYEASVEKCKDNFPQRNRIIAAISDGILVVEAAYRSGSSITARWAKEYKKKVFAVPGKIYEKMSVGTNNLIKRGAILSTSAEEIVENYPQFANKKRKTPPEMQEIKFQKNIQKDWEQILCVLELEMLSIEELQVKTQKDLRTLMKILSEMEIEGIIEVEIGIGYKLKSR